MSTTTITVPARAGAAAGWSMSGAVAGLISFLVAAVQQWRQQQRDAAHLRTMSDLALKDIGIGRYDIERRVARGRQLDARLDVI
ncbi:MAG TPA: DUF1127 domain-containing protein [Hyphomicrobiaceae bacterium]|nr:DUF1127 domain-containing protein [Hyphomicrobiaceae bacterium]